MQPSLDQSQRAAEPTREGTLAEVVGPLEGNNLEKDKANRARAERELGMFSELYRSTAFQWFMQEFIDTPYIASFDAYRDKNTSDERLPKVRAEYHAFREIKDSILARELVHRKRLSPTDPVIAVITEKRRVL